MHDPPNLVKSSQTVLDEMSSPGSEMTVTRETLCLCWGGVRECGLRRGCISGEGTTGSKEWLQRTGRQQGSAGSRGEHGYMEQQGSVEQHSARRVWRTLGMCNVSVCLFRAWRGYVHTEITTFSQVHTPRKTGSNCSGKLEKSHSKI